jgi:hypothetical protein
MVTAILLFRAGVIGFAGGSFPLPMIPQLIVSVAGILLLAGLWTPVVGTLIALIELWISLRGYGDPWLSLVLATLGGTSAMIGPGAWSLDARLYGRKHIAA